MKSPASASRSAASRSAAELGVLVAMAIWAANFTVVKAAVHAWPVLPFSALRITTAGLVVIAWSHLRGANVRMSRRDLLAASLFGAIGQGIYQLLWAGSLGTVNAGTSALLIAVTGFIGTVALTKYLQRGDIIELK